MSRSPIIALLLLASGLAKAQSTDRALVNPLASAPLEHFAATRERPLFSATRRPPPPPAVHLAAEPTPPPPPEPPSIVLVGVLTDEKGRRAFVRPNPTDKVREARVGDDVGGWRVAEIEPLRIILALEDRTKAFALLQTRGRPERAARRNTRQ